MCNLHPHINNPQNERVGDGGEMQAPLKKICVEHLGGYDAEERETFHFLSLVTILSIFSVFLLS
jgi:hypothetical protein